jgi:UDP-2-acetamido-2-deoxy-ribo-hexuluronate aminotransferase
VGTQGALVWDDDNITDKIKTVSCNGQLERNAPITSLGVNGVPFELQAAWIDVGLDFLAKWQARRQHIHEYYKMKFKNLPVCIIEAGEHCESNFSKFVLTTSARDDLHAFMNSNKTQTLKHYTDNFSEFFGSNKSFPQTEKFCDTVLSLPNHAWLTDAEIETVADLVNNFFDLK